MVLPLRIPNPHNSTKLSQLHECAFYILCVLACLQTMISIIKSHFISSIRTSHN